jgi:ketosteroid isomerase-like protein
MKKSILGLYLVVITVLSTSAQTPAPANFTKEEQEVVDLSKDKWQWMADKNVDKLAALFHDKAKFVHMSGTWKKDEELEIIKSGTIWYKKATIHDTAIEMIGKTAVVWNRITLESEVRGSDAKIEFTVTEVYQKDGKNWKMLALTFSSVRDTHVIKH